MIDQLKRQARSPRYEIDADRQQTTALHGEHAPASSPHDDEITGYGSHAANGRLTGLIMVAPALVICRLTPPPE